MSSPTEIADRCVEAHRLRATGASTQQIADQLGVSTDTVLRDLKRQPGPDAGPAQRLALRATQTHTVVRDAALAAQAVTDLGPAYTMTDDATATQWHRTLHAAAAQLLAAAAAFTDYYPCVATAAEAPGAAR